jgi:hypothetical protein
MVIHWMVRKEQVQEGLGAKEKVGNCRPGTSFQRNHDEKMGGPRHYNSKQITCPSWPHSVSPEYKGHYLISNISPLQFQSRPGGRRRGAGFTEQGWRWGPGGWALESQENLEPLRVNLHCKSEPGENIPTGRGPRLLKVWQHQRSEQLAWICSSGGYISHEGFWVSRAPRAPLCLG